MSKMVDISLAKFMVIPRCRLIRSRAIASTVSVETTGRRGEMMWYYDVLDDIL